MLLLLKTSSRKKTGKRHSGKRHSSKRHSGKRHSGKYPPPNMIIPSKQPIPAAFGAPQPIGFAKSPVIKLGAVPHNGRPMHLMPPMIRQEYNRKSSSKNLKGDLAKILHKVKQVQTNKKVKKYKQRLDKCINDASCSVNDKNCIKLNCSKELKKYTKRFDKEYKKLKQKQKH